MKHLLMAFILASCVKEPYIEPKPQKESKPPVKWVFKGNFYLTVFRDIGGSTLDTKYKIKDSALIESDGQMMALVESNPKSMVIITRNDSVYFKGIVSEYRLKSH